MGIYYITFTVNNVDMSLENVILMTSICGHSDIIYRFVQTTCIPYPKECRVFRTIYCVVFNFYINIYCQPEG